MWRRRDAGQTSALAAAAALLQLIALHALAAAASPQPARVQVVPAKAGPLRGGEAANVRWNASAGLSFSPLEPLSLLIARSGSDAIQYQALPGFCVDNGSATWLVPRNLPTDDAYFVTLYAASGVTDSDASAQSGEAHRLTSDTFAVIGDWPLSDARSQSALYLLPSGPCRARRRRGLGSLRDDGRSLQTVDVEFGGQARRGGVVRDGAVRIAGGSEGDAALWVRSAQEAGDGTLSFDLYETCGSRTPDLSYPPPSAPAPPAVPPAPTPALVPQFSLCTPPPPRSADTVPRWTEPGDGWTAVPVALRARLRLAAGGYAVVGAPAPALSVLPVPPSDTPQEKPPEKSGDGEPERLEGGALRQPAPPAPPPLQLPPSSGSPNPAVVGPAAAVSAAAVLAAGVALIIAARRRARRAGRRGGWLLAGANGPGEGEAGAARGAGEDEEGRSNRSSEEIRAMSVDRRRFPPLPPCPGGSPPPPFSLPFPASPNL
eukprot:tig00020629_g12334.t1